MRRRWVAGLGAATALLAGCTGVSAAAPEGTGAQPVARETSTTDLAWAACPPDVVAVWVQLQCATVPVPLDYDDPDGAQTQIMISRLASANPDRRRGVLLLDQGGPGGPGLTFADDLVGRGMPGSVLDAYDLISMDTRGVRHSDPVHCGLTDDLGYTSNIPPYAPDADAVTAQAEVARAVAERCAAHPDFTRLRHVTTANMARDLDRIRAALGEETASFLGYSYGSALGAAYTSLFPDRTDRVVLDSNVGDTHLNQDGIRRYGEGAEQTFGDFAAWAAQRHDTYGLGATADEVRATHLRIAERLDREPVGALDGAAFRFISFAGLYGETRYGYTAATAQALLDPAPAAAPTPAPGPTPSPQDNTFSVFLAATCNDVAWPRDVATYQQAVEADRAQFPIFGPAAANVLPCAFWAAEPAEPPVPVLAEGPQNVLVVQYTRDPVTPLRGGQLLDERFGERSRLLTVDESGHGVYVGFDNACARNTTTRFLVDGELPAGDVTC